MKKSKYNQEDKYEDKDRKDEYFIGRESDKSIWRAQTF